MKVVFRSEGMSLDPLLEAARLAEQAGGHALLTAENRFDPFLPLVLAAEHTTRIKIGPSVAIAFPRSPFMTAQLGWELQRLLERQVRAGSGHPGTRPYPAALRSVVGAPGAANAGIHRARCARSGTASRRANG